MTTLYPETVDVVVIGAGPGGAAAATQMARSGHSVLLLERRSLPRFHVGESLLPPTNALLERLGVLDRMKSQGYVIKHGAEFSGGRSGKFGRIPFSGQGPGRHPSTFQVERAHFDKTFTDYAQECGAHVLQEATVQKLLLDRDRVVGVRYDHGGAAHNVHARYVIDAGGRASKIAQTFGLRRTIDGVRMVAVYRHLTGLDERNNPGCAGDIQIHGHEDGWVWGIPIWADTISVGAVMPRSVLRAGDPEQLFQEHVSRAPRISARITGTRPTGELHVEADYSYYSDTITGPGWFMAGDAACFVDPIFSGGAFLAMTTGVRAAETVAQILAEPARAEELQHAYSNFYKTGYDVYARLIYAYYAFDYNLRPFLKSVGFDLAGDELASNKWLVRLLSGDFWAGQNELTHRLREQSRWDTFAPFEPAWGCPFYEHLNQQEAKALAVS
ncbi:MULTISPECIES: NAD(P)/FAD-dependent oxidoreductase [unclassified Micromonospora]|uniref:NAD(P)/FAD-dependent oxidoreductase n=1 Tax=unclassified Micromonospora TaxID=2617518 RepID=UPI00363B7310